MKLTLLSLVAPMLSIVSPVESSGLRDKSETAVATINGESGHGGRDLLDSWCAKDTPTKWHPDYSKAWNVAGCVYKADCNQVGSDTEAACCAAYYGGQLAGACAAINAAASGSTTPKWYADYGTAWGVAGCKNTLPYPLYASVFYDTNLECCKGAYAGQTSGACLSKLPSPPTSKPTAVGDYGTDWYADYGKSWSIAGCKNTLPRPVYAIMLYETQLACCKGAYGGQTSEACIKGLPSPPTKSPTAAPTNKPTATPTATPTSSPTLSPTTFKPTLSPTTFKPTTAAPVCIGGGTGVTGAYCGSGSPVSPTPTLCCSGNCQTNNACA